MIKYYVMGNDSRTLKLKELLECENKVVEDINICDEIICSIPFSTDDIYVNNSNNYEINKLFNMKKRIYSGAFTKNMKEYMNSLNVDYIDLMDKDEVAILNAIPTAEGAIYTAIEMRDITIHGSKVLVLGFGRCGKILAKALKGMGASVCIGARKNEHFAYAKAECFNYIYLKELEKEIYNFDYIFSTIPKLILDRNMLDKVDKKCAIIDIASKPGSIDFEYAKKLGLNINWTLALPSKVAPMSAALYLKEAIEKKE